MSAPTVGTDLLVFALPDLGEGLTEAELVSWLVAEGDPVAVDQPIAEVETAKSVVEVPSPFAGVVAVLHGRPGDVLDVGSPFLSVRPEGVVAEPVAPGSVEPAALGSVEPAADSSAIADPAAAEPAIASSAAAELAAAAVELREEAGVPASATHGDDQPPVASEGSGNVLIGYGTPGGLTGGRTRPRKRATTAPRPGLAGPATEQKPAGPGGTVPLCVSPLVRKLARDNGLRLADLEGSGDRGLILRRDVEHALAARHAGVPVADQPSSGIDVTSTDEVATGEAVSAPRDSRSGLTVLERTPLRGVRRTIADAMTRSRREIPEATVWVDVDVTALVELREGMKRKTPDAVPGILSFVARFVVAGLARYPELNSRIATGEDGAQELVRVDGVNLGIAAQTERGLVVPSVRRADTMSARALDAEIRRLAALAREGKATPSDLSSGTFTLNNYGVFGVDGSAAIINYPESAILGMGRIMERPWVVDGQLAVRKVTELTLAFDHRVCDGGTAGGFLRFVADAMENPGGMLADL